MNDRFKFRAWFDGRFIYKSLCDQNVYTEDGKCICLANTLPDLHWEQCTGSKDKNGKLIYEGDIVKEIILDEESAFGRELEEKSVVCFGGGDYPCSFTMKSKRFYKGFALLNYGINRIEIEVIGNIHENPELLEKEVKDSLGKCDKSHFFPSKNVKG